MTDLRAKAEAAKAALQAVYEHRRRHSPTTEWNNRSRELDNYFIDTAEPVLTALASDTAISALSARCNQLLHENERLRALVGEQAIALKRTPNYMLNCITEGCTTVLIREHAPPDEFVEQWLRGLGWKDGKCPICSEVK